MEITNTKNPNSNEGIITVMSLIDWYTIGIHLLHMLFKSYHSNLNNSFIQQK